MATRSSTPKHDCVHAMTGTVVLARVSKTEALRMARAMDKGSKRKRFEVRRSAKIVQPMESTNAKP